MHIANQHGRINTKTTFARRTRLRPCFPHTFDNRRQDYYVEQVVLFSALNAWGRLVRDLFPHYTSCAPRMVARLHSRDDQCRRGSLRVFWPREWRYARSVIYCMLGGIHAA